jgi:hypothetical protein
MRALKEQGKTTIRLTSSYPELMAEFKRIDAEVEVSVAEWGDEPAQPGILTSLWLKMLKMIPSRVTAALFRQKSTLSNIVTQCELRDGKFERSTTTLIVTTTAPKLRELLQRKVFMLEAAYFGLTGILASVRIETPKQESWTTTSTNKPTTTECTRSSSPRSASFNFGRNTTNSTSPPKVPTFAEAAMLTSSPTPILTLAQTRT